MILKDILNNKIDILERRGSINIDIKGLVYDSREVNKDYLFISIEGFKTDGHKYIEKAVNNGASAIVIEKDLDKYIDGITYLKVKDSRKAMSYLAEVYYNYPLKKISLIGVTGTNGKTTTTYLVKNILEEADFKIGLVGTIKNLVGDEELPATRTTPESLDLYYLFDRMVQAGVDYCVMEVSSHALDLMRVEGMEFEVAVFTNISQDHLDYHKSIESYLLAKSKLFKKLKENGTGVINLDDSHSGQILKSCKGNHLTYAINENADIKASNIKLSPDGSSFTIDNKKVDINLTGKFNIYNSLAAIGTCRALGLSDETIYEGLNDLKGVAGRLEQVDKGQNFSLIVDYAHTPDGMENVLITAKEIVKGNIIIVFGCGGDRDRGKRPIMAKISARYGDYSILTSDNPRSEDPIDILKELERGIIRMDKKVKYEVISDRRKAIQRAISLARKDDMIIIFGKGHENYQIFENKTIHFDDREEAALAIQKSMRGEELYGASDN